MSRLVLRGLFLASLAALPWVSLPPPGPGLRPSPAPRPWFEENAGQIDFPGVRFAARGSLLDVGFADGRVLYHAKEWRKGPEGTPYLAAGALFALEVGDGTSRPEALEPLPGRSHYLAGADPAQWKTGVHHFARILYPDAYPGIDLVYFFDPKGQLTYEFLVRPGADPSAIALRYTDVDGVELRTPQSAEVVTAVGRLADGPLVCFQEVDGARRPVASAYRADGASAYRVEILEPYDASRTLVVDPTVVFSTYYGNADANRTVSIDPAGNIYMSGGGNVGWPTTPGAYQTSHSGTTWPDVAVTKFGPTGAVVWSTLIGGPNEDYAYVSEVNASGEVTVAGRAGDGFPTTPGAFDTSFNGGQLIPNVHSATDGFVVRLSADGSSLLYSTYLGTNGNDTARGIHLLPTGEALISGSVEGNNLPTTPGAFQPNLLGAKSGFVAKLNATGSALVFCTYLGTNNDTNMEYNFTLALDAAGNIWTFGATSGSTGLTATPGAFQPVHGGGAECFVAKLNPSGTQLLYFSWLGGSGAEFAETEGFSDAQGNLYIAGQSQSPNFPTTPGAYQSALRGSGDGFVARINNDGTLGYSTLCGGSGGENFWGPARDAAGNIYASINTTSTDFPVTANAFQPAFGGGNADGGLVVFNPTLSTILYATYLGGSGGENARFVRVSPDNTFAAVALETGSTNFPLVNPVQTTPGVALVKFDIRDISQPGAAALAVSPAGGLSSTGPAGGPFTPSSASYTVTNTGGASVNWTAAATQGWVSLSSAGGTLAAGGSSTVTVSINAGAGSLGAGIYSDTVTFTNTTNGSGNAARAVSLTVTAPGGGPTLYVAPLAGPTATIDFAGREYLTLRQGLSGNASASPASIGTPAYSPAPGGTEVTHWTFVDGAAPVDTGFTWMSTASGNSFSLPFTGDATARTVKLYLSLYHASGSMDYAVTAGGSTATITKSTAGRSLYEIAVTFTASTTLRVQPAGNLTFAGFELAAALVEGVSPPPPPGPVPTGVAAMAGDGRVTLAWNPVAGATSYNVYMGTAPGVTRTNYTMSHTGVPRPFVHTGLANGTTCYFVVTAVTASGESGESVEVSATPTSGGWPIADTDGDGYSDAAEIAAGSNPNDPLSTPVDTDADGLADAWETAHFGGLGASPGADPDGDGAVNLVEYNAGTNPNLFDTDGDGYGDGAELAAGSNPLDPASIPAGPSGGGGGGGGGCGLSGMEIVLLGLLGRRRRTAS